MKVMLITGSYPPDVCGTADYTARLEESLQSLGVEAEVFYRKQWGVAHVRSLLREIDRSQPDLLHMQYPTTGYGWKLGPQAIGTLKPLIVTLHEASQSHILRQFSLYPFLLRSRHFIFTNPYERAHVERLAPWIAGRSTEIPIGCNLPIMAKQIKQNGIITCFSIIRPDKGLEDIIEAARLVKAQGSSVRMRVTGAVMPRYADYFHNLKAASESLPIDWITGLDDDTLSRVLAETSLAYLPFPDGASERRSSLVAMLMNQACVLTTVGDHTPEEMRPGIIAVASPKEAVARAEALFREPEQMEQVAARGAAYAQRFSWNAIGRQHLNVYAEMLGERKAEVTQ